MKKKEFLARRGVNIEKSLELLGDMDTYNDILKEFFLSFPEKKKEIKESIESKKIENYTILVHSLKSDAGYLGFEKLRELAYQQEMAGRENNTDYIENHFDELMNESDHILEVIKQYLDEATNPPKEKTNREDLVGEKTILVVDDSNIVRNFIKKVFNDTFATIVANDGKEALSIIEQNLDNNKIVGILLDLNMPNVNGFEVLEIFKKENLFSKIPVSIITGEASKEMIEKAFQYPIVDVLNKPFNESDIKKIVERTILYHESL